MFAILVFQHLTYTRLISAYSDMLSGQKFEVLRQPSLFWHEEEGCLRGVMAMLQVPFQDNQIEFFGVQSNFEIC